MQKYFFFQSTDDSSNESITINKSSNTEHEALSTSETNAIVSDSSDDEDLDALRKTSQKPKTKRLLNIDSDEEDEGAEKQSINQDTVEGNLSVSDADSENETEKESHTKTKRKSRLKNNSFQDSDDEVNSGDESVAKDTDNIQDSMLRPRSERSKSRKEKLAELIAKTKEKKSLSSDVEAVDETKSDDLLKDKDLFSQEDSDEDNDIADNEERHNDNLSDEDDDHIGHLPGLDDDENEGDKVLERKGKPKKVSFLHFYVSPWIVSQL